MATMFDRLETRCERWAFYVVAAVFVFCAYLESAEGRAGEDNQR